MRALEAGGRELAIAGDRTVTVSDACALRERFVAESMIERNVSERFVFEPMIEHDRT